MADEPEDVLELEDEQVIDDEEETEEGSDTAEDTEDTEEQSEEPFIGFEGEEAAPASESESSVIRDLRKANRELAKRNRELETGSAPKKIEVGEKPSLESCEYDEERYETELDAWKDRKAKADRLEQEAQERRDRETQEWDQRKQSYEADKAKLGVSNYDDAEEEVFASLPNEHQALLLMTEKPAALIYALSKNPTKLSELSKMNLARAAMTLGKLEDKLQMRTRKAPEPDRPVRGNAAPANADKELARLEKKAEQTGDRTEVIRYKRKLKQRA